MYPTCVSSKLCEFIFTLTSLVTFASNISWNPSDSGLSRVHHLRPGKILTHPRCLAETLFPQICRNFAWNTLFLWHEPISIFNSCRYLGAVYDHILRLIFQVFLYLFKGGIWTNMSEVQWKWNQHLIKMKSHHRI